MTDSDELLTKADALLARWRTGAVVPRPTADYPVLTDIVDAPAERRNAPLPELGSKRELPPLEASAIRAAESAEIPALYSPGEPILAAHAAADAGPAMPDAAIGPARLLFEADAPAPAEASAQALEERVYLRVLDAIEPHVGALIEEPLRLRIEELARNLATAIARDARSDIMALVREAVRSAVAHELDTRRGE